MNPNDFDDGCPSDCLCLMCKQRCDECDQLEYSDTDVDCPTNECEYLEEW